jgi:Transglutaminase-like superfamily
MNVLQKTAAILLFTFTAAVAFAQKAGRDFKQIDEYARKLGKLDSLNMGTIASLLTKNFTDKTDKARAIFTWIATNISYDVKMARSGSGDKNAPAEVLITRKALGAGYANLFQDMCSVAGIRCLTVDGFVKFSSEQIDDAKTEINHTWNVVQLGQSPEAWYYVDVCRGSGYTDADFRIFTPAYNDEYFFANLTIFNWEHCPDNESWYLGPRPKGKKDFFELPAIKSAAYQMGLKRFTPNNGSVKAKVGKPFNFSFQLKSDLDITKVALVFGEEKKKKEKPMEFSFNGGILSFSYKPVEEDSYPVTVTVNGKELLVYKMEVSE